nr:putative ribonuclease H-like domain-containing protein [Tanacetum cinerariifolium]
MCDNKAAIQISENPVQHDRTKHVEVDRHFIKEKLEAGIIELPFVKSSDQLADILIKAVATAKLQWILSTYLIGTNKFLSHEKTSLMVSEEDYELLYALESLTKGLVWYPPLKTYGLEILRIKSHGFKSRFVVTSEIR